MGRRSKDWWVANEQFDSGKIQLSWSWKPASLNGDDVRQVY